MDCQCVPLRLSHIYIPTALEIFNWCLTLFFYLYKNTVHSVCWKTHILHHKERISGGNKLEVLWAKSLSLFYIFLCLRVLKYRDFHLQSYTWFFKTNTIKEIKTSLQGQNQTGQPSKQSLLPCLSYKTFNKLLESTSTERYSCRGYICQAQDTSCSSSRKRTNELQEMIRRVKKFLQVFLFQTSSWPWQILLLMKWLFSSSRKKTDYTREWKSGPWLD